MTPRVARIAAVVTGLLLLEASPARGQTPNAANPAVAAAEAAARAWLSLIDGGRYGDSWDGASTLFRHAVTRSGWEVAVRIARGPFEPLGSRTLLDASFQTNLPNAPPGEYVVIHYQTQAGGGKTVVEMITPMKDDGQWRIAGYYIRPK